MAKRADEISSYIRNVRFVGRRGGPVKTLGGFKKSHHTVPDAVNAATSAFLARLCADELADEAETFFQRARTIFGYKRAELSLDVASPAAVLTAKDFVFELGYALDERDAASFVLTRTLHGIRNGEIVPMPEFESIFAQQFSEIVFALTKGAPVEAVIDAVEGLDDADGLTVSYPSHCRECMLAVDGVAAEVRFDGAQLAMMFPRSGSPRELLEAFAAVRHAFALAKKPALAALLK